MRTLSSDPSGLADRVEDLRQERRFKEALEAVDRCLQENPGHARALLLQGRILYQEGKVLQALEALRPLDSILGRNKGLKTITTALGRLWQTRSSQMDPAFVTESMAGVLVRQGYLLEATEIYRQLYLASKGERRLWEEILLLRDRLEREGSREKQRESVAKELEILDRWMENRQRGL